MNGWSPRLLIVGWDGADWSLLKPLVAQGKLPHLAALMAHGTAAALRSTLPPITAPAWTSFATGLHPGHHGLLSWQYPLDAAYQRPWADSSAAGRARLWDRLGQAGLRTGVIGLPLTYPALPVAGVMISGMLTPGLDSAFIHPPELADPFRRALPTYPFDVDLQNVERDVTSTPGIGGYLAELTAALRQRAGATRFLWEHGPFDCVIAVFETPDRVQHPFHQFVAGQPAAPRPDWEAVRELVLDLYVELDAALGELLARIDLAQTTVMMVSDHGFGPLRRDFFLTNWLVQAGYATYADARVAVRGALARGVRPFKRWIPTAWLRQGRRSFAAYRQLAWEQTRAYPGISTEEGVWINLRGREPAGIVAPGAGYDRLRGEIAGRLLALRDPLDAAPVVTAVWPREEIYGEPYRDRAPDLIFRMSDGYRMVAERGQGQITAARAHLGKGIHRAEGLFLVAGRGAARREQVGYVPHLVDVVPTALALLGLPQSGDLDGVVLQEMLPDLPVAALAEAAGDAANADTSAPTSVYTDAEADVVRRRLAALGYLD